MKFINLIAFASLAALAFAGLSSDQALELAGGKKGYLNEGESAKLLASTPVDVEGERYWIAYFYQTSAPDTKNLFVAVSDNTGLLERDAEKLKRIFSLTHKLAILDSLKAGKASLDDIELFSTDAEKARQAADEVFFRNVKQQIEVKYADLSFKEIEAGLQDVKGAQERLRDHLRETRSLKGQFEVYGTSLDFDNYFTAYNETFARFGEAERAVSKYQAGVLQKADEVTNSPSLNFSDKQEIKQVLEKLYDLGDYKGFKAGVADPASRVVALQLQREANAVTNNVDSALFRLAKKDAEYAYSQEVKQSISQLLAPARESELRACAIDVSELKRAWGDVRAVMENPANVTRAAYEAIPEKAGKASELAADASRKLNDCVLGPAPTPAPRQDNLVQNAVIALAVVALAYYGYTRYKKWREESE